MNGFPPNFAQL